VTPRLALSTLFIAATTSSAAAQPVPVTVDNFVRAETDLYFGNGIKHAGGLGKLSHDREPLDIDHQRVIRGNRDTLYSTAVFDLDAGPVTVELPDAGKRFMSLQIISEDQYTWTEYGAGVHTLDRDSVGTRYVMVGVRTLIDPKKPGDLQAAHALQDKIKVTQPSGPGTWQVPDWDKTSQTKVREALLVLASTVKDTRRAFGRKEEVDPVQYLLGAASAWGANAPKDAIYLNVVPPKNDGVTSYALTATNVPVDGFWSISVYNEHGYYQKNALNLYSVNNIMADKERDGTTRIQFGGCDAETRNCLPIMKNLNYMVRLYRPRAEILSGSWNFPTAEPLKRSAN
jgi:hypothetical protein